MKKVIITGILCLFIYSFSFFVKKADNPTTALNALSMTVPHVISEKNDADLWLVKGRVVNADIRVPQLNGYNSNPELSNQLTATEDRSPKIRLGGYRNKKIELYGHDRTKLVTERTKTTASSKNGSTVVFDAGGQLENMNNTDGGLFVPADSHGAAGPNHVMNAINASIEAYNKNGGGGVSTSLQSFFSPLFPVNATFDPKIIYDQFSQRWLVVTLERTDTSQGDPSNTSRVLLAVSENSDPNGLWNMVGIDTKLNIAGIDYWFDYPGIAVDEEAIYLTGNMFEFGQGGGVGSRLWIFEKSSFYAGGGLFGFGPLDPFVVTNGINVTSQPAHVFGSTPNNFGTYLTGYSTLTDGTNEFWQTIRIDNPLTSPLFTLEFTNIGDVESSASSLPEAPQAGSSTNTGSNLTLATNDSRALNAVWMNNKLYSTAMVQSNQELGQTSASWVMINADGVNATSPGQFGVIFGEQIANNTFTFFPSIAVNSAGVVGLGYSASASNIFAGSYFSYRMPGDAVNTMRAPQLIRQGEDFYNRTFGGSTNRWGDYSATTLDPVNDCFWVYNKHATTRGFTTGQDDDGMFGTSHGRVCVDNTDVIFSNGFE